MRIIVKKPAAAPRPAPAKPYASIDPGVDGTGWAVFLPGHLEPAASGAVQVGRAGEWGDRAADTARAVFRAVMDGYLERCTFKEPATCGGLGMVFVEEPQFMEGGRGIVAARGGDLVKLCLLAGMVVGQFSSSSRDLLVRYVPVIEWKGSLPKDVTDRRVRAKLRGTGWEPSGTTTHEIDAVGLGLYVKGVL